MKRIALCLAVLAACGKGPAIASFTADKTSLTQGDPVTLTWQVSNASRVEIDNGVGVVTGTTTVVNPQQTSTYTLTASSGSASVTKTVAIDVTPAPRPAVISSLTATPPQAGPGDPVKLEWTVDGELSQDVNGQAVPKGTHSLVVSVATTTTYTLTVAGPPSLAAPAPVSVVVRVAPRPAVTTFSASCGTCMGALQGDDVTLSWAATNATSFTVTDDKGHSTFVGPLLSLTVQPTATTTYTLVASGPGGSAPAKSVTVIVSPSSGASLAFADPVILPTANVVVKLRSTCSPCVTMQLELVTTQTVTADALALDLPMTGANRVKLHLTGTAPDWTVNTLAINPGVNPPAAAIALPESGPLNRYDRILPDGTVVHVPRMLTIGIARKPAGNGAVTTPLQPIPMDTVLASFKLDLVPEGGTGLVFDGKGASFTLRNGPGSASAGTFAAGTLRAQ